MKEPKAPIKSFKALKSAEPCTLEEYRDAFGVHISCGFMSIREAGATLTEAIRKYPTTARAAFRERYPGVGTRTWELLERIGSNDLHPSAILLPYETAKAVCHIPIERQNRMFASGVKGFNVVNRSTLQPRVVAISQLTANEAELLIDIENGEVRSVAEQRKLILDRQKEAAKSTVVKDPVSRESIPYRICGNVCIIGEYELSLGTLKGIVAEMEARQNRGRMPWRPDRQDRRGRGDADASSCVRVTR